LFIRRRSWLRHILVWRVRRVRKNVHRICRLVRYIFVRKFPKFTKCLKHRKVKFSCKYNKNSLRIITYGISRVICQIIQGGKTHYGEINIKLYSSLLILYFLKKADSCDNHNEPPGSIQLWGLFFLTSSATASYCKKGLGVLEIYRVIKKSIRTWLSLLEQPQNNWWFEDGHHRTHSDCGPCCTEHGIREHSSACQ